jgi:signal transduction histidine kinase
MRTTGDEGVGRGVRTGALGTRGRLLAAFAALAAAFAAAFGLQLVRLARMAGDIAELRDHQEEMALALRLEHVVREAYGRSDGTVPGDEVRGAADPAAQVGDLLLRLAATVDEPEAIVWVDRLSVVTQELAARRRAERAAGEAPETGAEHARLTLVLELEDHVNRLFAFLRDRNAALSAGVEEVRRDSVRVAVGFAAGLAILALAIGAYLARFIGRQLATLVAELNGMAAALERHQERLARSEKLAGLGRVAAKIAREINNPLQVMIGYLTLYRGGADVSEHLARVAREAQRCKELVDGLVQLSRPRAMAPPEPVDLRRLSEEVAEEVRMAVPAPPALRVAGSGEALGSPARLRQVLFNLVKNAAEAAGPMGLVEVEVASSGDTARVVVSDTGPGVPAHLRDRLFEPFVTTKLKGHGLGLALARAVAQSHGADVALEDSDVGARFVLSAPRR